MKVKSLFFFTNGNVAALDENGEQIPDIQVKTWIDVYLEFVSSVSGQQPDDIEEIRLPDGKRAIPFKTPYVSPLISTSGWNWEIKP